MTSPAGSRTALPDRRVALGSLAVRPVLYRGTNGGTPFPPPETPITGLIVRSTSSSRAPFFHESTNVYGFVDLTPVPATHRIQIVDPARRYLPRAVTVSVPDRSALAVALAAGATALPAVSSPPFVVVPLRPWLSAPITEETALFGVASGGPFAWIRATTPQGVYVTYGDLRGEYLLSLSFLRPVLAPDTTGGDDPFYDTRDVAPVQTSFAVQLDAYALLAPPAAGSDPLAAFPAQFDALAPENMGTFSPPYQKTPFASKSINVQVGTQTRLDL